MDFSFLAPYTPVLSGVIRNLWGWIPYAIKDKTITNYEWEQLIITTIEVGGVTLLAQYGLQLDPVQAGAIGIGISYLISKIPLFKGLPTPQVDITKLPEQPAQDSNSSSN